MELEPVPEVAATSPPAGYNTPAHNGHYVPPVLDDECGWIIPLEDLQTYETARTEATLREEKTPL